MTSTLCPTCSCRIPAHAPEGLCPRCLVSAGLVGSLGTQPASSAASLGSDLLSVEELGELLPHREIEALIGRGGMGTVYRAHDPRLGRRLAIKVLNGELAADPAFVERFAREARAVARLEHPNIVQIHQFVDDPDLPYLELEFVPGQSLRELLGSGPLRLDRGREILRQVAAGLGYAHREGVVHRDVKPENVLVDEEGRVRLVDFGLAKITKGRTPGSLTLTGARQVVGTIHYMAPEQLEAPETVDARSDVYSWGVIAYEVLTGRLPLGRFGPPSRYAEVGPELDAIVLKALEREPEDRFADGAQLRSRLEGHLGTSAKLARQDPAPASRPRETPIALGLIALALVAVFGLVVVAALIVVWLFRPPSAEREQAPPRVEARPLPRPEGKSSSEGAPRTKRRDAPGEARLRSLEAGARLLKRVEESRALRTQSREACDRDDYAKAESLLARALAELESADDDLGLLEGDVATRARAKLREAGCAVWVDQARLALSSPNERRIERARHSLTQLASLYEGEALPLEALEARARLNLLTGRVDEAGSDYQRWVTRAPESPAALTGLGRAFTARGRSEEGLALFERAFGLLEPQLRGPERAQGAAAGQVLELQDSLVKAALAEAIRTSQAALAERWVERSVDSLLGLAGSVDKAQLLSSRGDLFGALDELRQVYAAAGDPATRAEAERLQARFLLRFGRAPEARQALARAEALAPRREAKLLEGQAWRLDCELARARAALKEAEAGVGSWEYELAAEVQRELARLSFAAGELSLALEHAQRAHALNSLDPLNVACLARVQLDPYFEGRYLEAAEALLGQGAASPRTLALRSWAALQKRQPARSRRLALSVPQGSRSTFLLDLAWRGASQAQPFAARDPHQTTLPSPCAVGQGFEATAREGKREEGVALWGKARVAYRAALWDYPFDLRARLGLVRCAEAAGQREVALAGAKRAAREHPSAPAAARALALCLGSEPGSPQLFAAYDQAIKVYGETPELLAASVLGRRFEGPPAARARDALMITSLIVSRTDEVQEAKVELLRRVADQIPADPTSGDRVQELRARADELAAEQRKWQTARGKRLKGHIQRARGEGDAAKALSEARAACLLAPRFGGAWALYADLLLRARQPRAALRASACAAWLDGRHLDQFMFCLQVRGQGAPFASAPPAPADLGLQALLRIVERVSEGEASGALNLELEDLERRHPEQLMIPCLNGVHALVGKKLALARGPLAFAATQRPQGPLSYLAGKAYASLPDEERSPGTDTLAILFLRAAKAAGLSWEEDAIREGLRRSAAWAWLERPFDLAK